MRLWFFAALVVCGASIVGCTSSSNGPYSPLPIAPTATPTVAATLPALPATPAFSVTTTTTLSASASVPSSIPLVLPSAGGFSGMTTLSAATNYPPNTPVTLVQALSSSAASIVPSTIPPVSRARSPLAVRSAQANAYLVPLAFFSLTSSLTLDFANGPALSVSVPPAFIFPAGSATYWLAYDDVLRPSLGWQFGYEGPATVSGSTLAFAAPSPAVAFALTANVPAYFCVYALPASQPIPTPAPSISPVAPPTPLPALSLAPSSVSILALGATTTSILTDSSGYAGPYVVRVADPTVATASLNGTTLTVTGIAVGNTSVTISDTNARTVTLGVQVTTTTLPLH